MSQNSLGLIETYGLLAAIEAADTAVKSANVTLVGYEFAKGSGMTTVKIEGNVGAVNSAVAAAQAAVLKIGKVASVKVIPRPATGIECLVKNAETKGYTLPKTDIPTQTPPTSRTAAIKKQAVKKKTTKKKTTKTSKSSSAKESLKSTKVSVQESDAIKDDIKELEPEEKPEFAVEETKPIINGQALEDGPESGMESEKILEPERESEPARIDQESESNIEKSELE